MILNRIIFICCAGIVLLSCQTDEGAYDAEHPQVEILTYSQVDSVLSQFEQVSYARLPEDYKTYSLSTWQETKLASKKYYVVKGDEVFQYIVGTYRIRNFLCRDKYFSENAADYDQNKSQLWLVDKQLLYTLVDLINELDEQGYDQYGFELREGHRHPKYNALAGGASQSQHLFGTAVDLVIEDINQDGEITPEDKDIVLEILEEIVGDKGGLGLYPGGMTVHVDTRGYRARWDKQ